MTLTFRAFRNCDYPGVCSLLEQLSQVQIVSKYPRCDHQLSTYRVVGLIGSELICYGQLTFSARIRGGLSAYVEDIVVSSEYKRLGVGTKLILHLREIAREKGVYKLTLTCSKDIISFYERCGFILRGVHLDLFL